MILCILQARMSSSRLPGKVLKPILGKPMLSLQLERVKQSKLIDKIIIATSTDPSDDAIENLYSDSEFDVFRGSLEDVLERYYMAAKKYKPDHVMRLTGDCPLIDPEVIDSLINYYTVNDFDYACNTFTPTFPDGQDAWIFKYELLVEAWNNAALPSEREHVTMYFKNNIKKFNAGDFKNFEDLSDHRWTVDEPVDFEKIEIIYEALYPCNKIFNSKHIVDFLKFNPDVETMNSAINRDEGLVKSLKLEQDGKV